MALRSASAYGDRGALLATLAAADAELEARDENGETAFLLACKQGHAECIAALADAGTVHAVGCCCGCRLRRQSDASWLSYGHPRPTAVCR
jgi:hypothetical protein